MQFNSFFGGGFECSTHKLASGERLDLVRATEHDRWAMQDYARLKAAGLRTVREGLRWHLIERSHNRYDFSTMLPMVRAAQQHDLQVIWDICHYGYPDDLDIFSAAFIRRFARLARQTAMLLAQESDALHVFCPVNEISFFSWAGGDAGHLNPYAEGRSFELKQQLVRAVIEGMEAIQDVLPEARFIHTDPLVHIVPNPAEPEQAHHARSYRNAQFQAWDMLAGQLCPELGGRPDYLDVIGVNFYPHNEWIYRGPTLSRFDPEYVPLRALLAEVYARYGRPLYLAETSAEGDQRAGWMRYIADEAWAALTAGVDLCGICWYPITDYPGWVDARHAQAGLWGFADDTGRRTIHAPLAAALADVRAQHDWPTYQTLTTQATVR